MSETDSFIDEVTEEVRRDRLFALFRKYGWIGAVVIAGIVGGTAWQQWQAAADTARAQAFGDAVLAALESATPEERIAALKAVPADGAQGAVIGLLLASDPAVDRAGALAALAALGADASQPDLYRDLANLRLVLLSGAEMPLEERRGLLEAMAAQGRPFRALAQEQIAYLLLEAGERTGALEALTALLTDPQAGPAMKDRLARVITALGGEVPQAAEG